MFASLTSGLGGGACMCDITLDAESNRKTAPLGKDKGGERAYIYTDGEDISGTAVVSIKPGKKVDHQGIKVELVASIENTTDRSGNYDFFCISKDLDHPGSLFETKQFKWQFKSVDKQNESYYGTNVRLRYFVRLTVVRGYGSNVTKEVDFVVQNLFPAPEINNSIKMEVAIEDCLHIEFEYERSKLHLKDVVVGKVYFLLVRIKIKHMEVNINRTEVTGGSSSDKQVSDKETLTKFEIMDGAPVRDQCIPVRFYLTGTDVTPTFKNVQNKFSVKYFLSLVIVDEEDRRYFKQSEIFLYCKKIG